MDRAREQVEAAEARADAQTDQARRDADAARRETATAIADARSTVERERAEAAAARDAGADAHGQRPRPPAPGPTPARPRPRGRGPRSAGCARRRAGWRPPATPRSAALTAAHQAALDAERARATPGRDRTRRDAPGRHRDHRPLRFILMAAERGAHALYQKVAEDIKAAIASGEYPASAKLPSENELAQRYGVSRGTIRQAFAALRADGVIASRRGARRVVFGGPRVQSFGELLSFSRWARAAGEVPGGRVISLDRRPATPTEAARLGAARRRRPVRPGPGQAAVRPAGDGRARGLPRQGRRARRRA